MSIAILNIHDEVFLNEAPSGSVVIGQDSKNKDKYRRFNFYNTIDIFYDPFKTLSTSSNLVFPSRDEIEFIYNNFLTYSFQINRWTSKRNQMYQLDQNTLFETLIFWLTIIKHHGITKTIIDEDPHRGIDYVGYLICKYKKIPTYIISNLNMSGYRSYIKTSIQSGLNSSIKMEKLDRRLLVEISSLEVNLNHTGVLPLKKSNTLKRKSKFLPKLLGLFTWRLLIRPKPHFRILYPIAKLLFLTKAIINRFLYICFYKIFSIKRISVKENDIVYYSHYFPERTSVPLADPFGFNILQPLYFLKKLPNRIIYKEHPVSLKIRNNHRNRCFHDLAFMQTLIKLKIPLSCEINDCKHIVCTLNGSAGIEFAMKGYKVICFGNPWYSFLPNVYSYKDPKSLAEFVNCKVNYNVNSIHRSIKDHLNIYTSAFNINDRYCGSTLDSKELKRIFAKRIFS